MVEIIEYNTFSKYTKKNGETIIKPKIATYERKYTHVGRPPKTEVNDDKKSRVIELYTLPYKISLKEISNQTNLSPYLVRKIINEYNH